MGGLIMNEQVFNVTGMVCDGCASNVENAVKALPGISCVQVSLADKNMKLRMDPEKVTAGQIIKAVKDAGYDASPVSQS